MVTDTYIRTTFKIKREILNKVKIEAINRNMSQNDIIIEYILQGLERDEKQRKLDVE